MREVGRVQLFVEGELQAKFSEMRANRPFRRCQQMALDAFERAGAAGRRRAHLVLPPGTGKTMLGLEIARRLGRHTLVLCPNTAIQAQWAQQWQGFQPPLVRWSAEADDLAPLTILTYQALCVLDSDDDALTERSLALWEAEIQETEGVSAEAAREAIEQMRDSGVPHYRTELANFRRRARRLIAEGGEREELLALLHPRGRHLLDQMRRRGPWTLVLDECHHLLELWGYLVRAFVAELGDATFVLGLTATPPRDLDGKQEELYRDLFVLTDFERPTPAAVKDGSLAPSQDLAYLTVPLPHELDYIYEQHGRFLRLISRLMDQDFGNVPFVDWIQRRVAEAPAKAGSDRSWDRFEHDRPHFALAALRFLHRYGLDLPEGARLQERHRQDLDADDWVVLVEDYCLRQLKLSGDPRDAEAWNEIRAALPSVGYVLTTRGIRSYVSPVDRVLALSASKGAAALAILDAEQRALGAELRALLLCDYEHAGSDLLAKLRGVLDPQAGSAALLLRLLLADPGTARLNPILMTGKTVACSRATAYELIAWMGEQVQELGGTLRAEQLATSSSGQPGWEDLVAVRSTSRWWRPRHYVRIVTDYFEGGRSRCLVGTRGLLGEGWDARRVNVLIDLTAATTSTAVHQSRGRSLRLDPALPGKVADNWDVVCLSPAHPKGSSDYARFVRKHRHYYALTADGEIESGVSHVHPSLSPYGAPHLKQFTDIDRAMLQRPLDRETVLGKWAVGQPYKNREIQTLRVRFGRPSQPSGQGLPRAKRSGQSVGRPMDGCTRLLWFLAAIGLAALTLAASRNPSAALLVLAIVAASWLGLVLASPLLRADPTGGIAPMALAVAEGLRAVGAISAGAGDVRVVLQSDGHYRCYLAGASTEESALFTEALDELVAPLGRPRCIIPRFILDGSGRRERVVKGLRYYLAPDSRRVAVVYHAVPGYFAANGKRLKLFAWAWHRHVSPGSNVLHSHGFLAQAILEAHRGENPLEVSTQTRTLWE